MTGGLLSFVSSNVYDMAGTTTEAKFEEMCEMLFTFGSDRKLLVCSHKFGSVINGFAKDKIETRSGEETYGIRLKTYKSYHGSIVPSLPLRRYAGLVWMDYVKYRPLKGRDTSSIQTSRLTIDAGRSISGLQVRLRKFIQELKRRLITVRLIGTGKGRINPSLSILKEFVIIIPPNRKNLLEPGPTFAEVLHRR